MTFLGHLPKETVSQVEEVSRNTGNLFSKEMHHTSELKRDSSLKSLTSTQS